MSKSNGRFENGNTAASKYKADYCEQMLAFFKDEDCDYPTFELFAETIGVTNDTLLNWREKYPRFRNIYARCKNIQKGRTVAGGMTGRYNPQIVKFMAINNFGMVEKVESDNSVRFDISIPKEIDEESD